MCVFHIDVEVVSIRTISRDTDIAGIQVEQAALAFAGNGFGEVQIPAQAIVQGQLLGNSPLVLSVKEPPLLPLGGGSILKDGAEEIIDIAQQECGEAYALACRAGGDRLRKLKLPGKQVVVIYANQVIQRPTNVSAKADVVVANGMRPVVHPLKLALDLVIFMGSGSKGDQITAVDSIRGNRDVEL